MTAKIALAAAASFLIIFAAAPLAVQAQVDEARCGALGGRWDGNTCIDAQTPGNLSNIIRSVSNILVFIVGAVSVIMLIIGGFRYVVSGGDQAGIEGAKNTILYAVIGLAVAIMAFAIVNFVLGALT